MKRRTSRGARARGRRCWCGFVDGKPDAASRVLIDEITGRDLSFGGYGLFTSERKARKAYSDVRLVEVCEVRSARGRSK